MKYSRIALLRIAPVVFALSSCASSNSPPRSSHPPPDQKATTAAQAGPVPSTPKIFEGPGVVLLMPILVVALPYAMLDTIGQTWFGDHKHAEPPPPPLRHLAPHPVDVCPDAS